MPARFTYIRDTSTSSSDLIRILFVSDTHGPIQITSLPPRSEFDIMCHAGDWFPDPNGRLRNADVVGYQRDFLRYEASCLAAYLGDTPFVFTLGNHDFMNTSLVEEELRTNGVNVYNPNDRAKVISVREKTLSFRGFRYIPWIHGGFCGELDDVELKLRTNALKEEDFDVLISHCPPSGKLSRGFGNDHLRDNLLQPNAPLVNLVGHIHETGGRTEVINRTLVVNAAKKTVMVDV